MSVYSERGEKLKKENKAAVEEQTAAKKDELDIQVDQQIQSAEQKAAAGIADADARYRDVVDTAAVQRELDRRQIQETMANMGLGRSGLNATQQTAVQLSAGNKMAAASLQRQAAVDSLKKSLAEYKMASEDARRQGKMELDESAQKEIAAFDASVDKGVSEAESTEYKAKQEADAKKHEADTEAATALAKMQIESVQNQQEEAVERNLKLLDKMYEEGQLSTDMYMLAVENGWTINYVNQVSKIADEVISEEKSPVAKLWGKIRGETAASKDDIIYKICSYFPLPEGNEQDVHEVARNYLFNQAGVTKDDISKFIEADKKTTTK